MSQTSVTSDNPRCYEGMLAEFRNPDFDSLIASGRVLFGKAVGSDPTDVSSGDPSGISGQQGQALDATNSHFQGIAVAMPASEAVAGQAYGSYEAEDTIRVLRRGRVWVVSGDAVDDLSKSVFVRNAAEGTLPAAGLGSFRATTATNYIDLGAIAPVRWVAGETVGGINYGLLEIGF